MHFTTATADLSDLKAQISGQGDCTSQTRRRLRHVGNPGTDPDPNPITDTIPSDSNINYTGNFTTINLSTRHDTRSSSITAASPENTWSSPKSS